MIFPVTKLIYIASLSYKTYSGYLKKPGSVNWAKISLLKKKKKKSISLLLAGGFFAEGGAAAA